MGEKSKGSVNKKKPAAKSLKEKEQLSKKRKPQSLTKAKF